MELSSTMLLDEVQGPGSNPSTTKKHFSLKEAKYAQSEMELWCFKLTNIAGEVWQPWQIGVDYPDPQLRPQGPETFSDGGVSSEF